MGKSLKNFLVIGVILIILVIIFLNLESFKDILISGSNYDLKELKREAVINIGENTDFYPYNKSLILYNDEEIKVMSRDKEKKEEVKLARESREIVFGEKKFYLIDMETGKVKLYEEDARLLGELNLGKGIYRLVERKNHLIGHFKQGDREVVKILKPNGKEVGTFTSDNYILIYDKGSKDYIISLIEDSNKIRSQIYYMDQDNKEVWKLDFENEVILSNIILNNGKVLIQTDENIYFLDQGNIGWEKKIDDIKDLKYIDGKIYILYYKSLEAIDLEGEVVFNISLEKNYEKIFAVEDYIFLGGRRNILGIRDSEKILEFTAEKDIKDIKNTENNIFIKSGNDIIVYKIIGKQMEK